MSEPILPFDVWPQGIVQASVPANRNALRSQVLGSLVLSRDTQEQPTEPAEGSLYILPAGASGSAWSGFDEGDLAIFQDGAWYAFAPVEGVVLAGVDGLLLYTGGAWVDYSAEGGGGVTQFVELTDTPADYTGAGGQFVAVDAEEGGLVFVPAPEADPSSFVDLTDTPEDYTGAAGQVVVVNSTEDGLEFTEITPGGASSFVELEDTPEDYTGAAGKVVVVNSTEDGLEFTEFTPGGASSFVELEDTPEDYTGAAGQVVVVNSTEDGLEFTEFTPGGASSFVELEDTPEDYTGAAGQVVVVNSTEDGLEFTEFTPGGASSFVELEDTPEDYTGAAGRFVVVNQTEDGLEFVPVSPGGASEFVQLTDTPEDYTGAAGFKVVVNNTEDGLEFVPDSGGSAANWLTVSEDLEPTTPATAEPEESMAVGPGAVAESSAQVFPASGAGSYGAGLGTGYILFDDPVAFNVGQVVEVSGLSTGGPATYDNYGLSDPEDDSLVVLSEQANFRIGSDVVVENAANPDINGTYPITELQGFQTIRLGGGFSATEEDLVGATFTSVEPDMNGPYEISDAYTYQINLIGFDFYFGGQDFENLQVSLPPEGKSLAIGPGAQCLASNSVALGHGTECPSDRSGVVHVGGRRLAGLANPTRQDEAVTLEFFYQNQRYSEPSASFTSTFETTDTEVRYLDLMFEGNGDHGFTDGKMVAASRGAVSTWRFSFKTSTDSSGTTVSAFVLEPVSVDPEHEDLEFEAVPETGGNQGWKFVGRDPNGPTEVSAVFSKTIVWVP